MCVLIVCVFMQSGTRQSSSGTDTVVDVIHTIMNISFLNLHVIQCFFKFQEDERRSESLRRNESERYDDESDESDADDFIVDDFGVPIAGKKRNRRPVFTDRLLQEGQDIFGVDFDYNEFEQYEVDEYEDESADEDEYEEEERGEKRTKKVQRKKVQKKSIFDIYEPSELKRGHFTDLDNHVSYYYILFELKLTIEII